MIVAKIADYDDYPDPYFVVRDRVVDISDEMRKCVAFLGTRENGKFVPRATVFFVSYMQDQHQFDHMVTAEHVVSGLLTKNKDMWLRANLVGGGVVELPLPHDAFYFHPNADMEPTDVAVSPVQFGLVDEETGKKSLIDARVIPLSGPTSFAPTEWFKKTQMGLGKEIVTIGLFRSHYGKDRNVPVIRVGNIAAKPEEPIHTSYCGYMKAYLVEARSIAGLSGSPVFSVMDSSQFMTRTLARHLGKKDLFEEEKPQVAAMVGLMHGHFDIRNLNEDVVTDDGTASVHTGMGVVVPVEKIIETLEHPDLVAKRKKIVANLRKETGATADVFSEPAPQASDENPTHLEDFTSLLGKAAKTPPQDD